MTHSPNTRKGGGGGEEYNIYFLDGANFYNNFGARLTPLHFYWLKCMTSSGVTGRRGRVRVPPSCLSPGIFVDYPENRGIEERENGGENKEMSRGLLLLFQLLLLLFLFLFLFFCFMFILFCFCFVFCLVFAFHFWNHRNLFGVYILKWKISTGKKHISRR